MVLKNKKTMNICTKCLFQKYFNATSKTTWHCTMLISTPKNRTLDLIPFIKIWTSSLVMDFDCVRHIFWNSAMLDVLYFVVFNFFWYGPIFFNRPQFWAIWQISLFWNYINITIFIEPFGYFTIVTTCLTWSKQYWHFVHLN